MRLSVFLIGMVSSESAQRALGDPRGMENYLALRENLRSIDSSPPLLEY